MSSSCKGLISKYSECMRLSECMKVGAQGMPCGMSLASIHAGGEEGFEVRTDALDK